MQLCETAPLAAISPLLESSAGLCRKKGGPRGGRSLSLSAMLSPARVAVLLATGLLCLIAAGPAGAETTQHNGIRLSLSGSLDPTRLPRQGSAPVAVSISGRIAPTSETTLPQLRRIAIAINRFGRLDTSGLPQCRIPRIQPATSAEALAACRGARIGHGHFSADVRLPEASPFPSEGKILAFNGRWHGRPAILAQIYGIDPAPTSYVLPFAIRRSRGTFGTVLEAQLPPITGSWGFVTGVSLELGRSFRSHGRVHSYLAAGCPAPAGLTVAPFPLTRASFDFAGGTRLVSTLTRTCTVAR